MVRLTLSLPSSSSRRPSLERTGEREGEAERESGRTFPFFEPFFLYLSSIVAMAKVQLVDPVPWGWSTADRQHLESLVASGLLAPNTDPARPLWIAPRSEATPNPPSSYVVSLARLHERGFGVPAGRFIRALCHHYEVELHNFAPTPSRKRRSLLPSARATWGSQSTGTCGGISSGASSTPSPFRRG